MLNIRTFMKHNTEDSRLRSGSTLRSGLLQSDNDINHKSNNNINNRNENFESKKATPTLKVVLLGDLGVGKTCLRSQFVHHIFTNAYKATIGGDYLTTSVYIPSLRSDSIDEGLTSIITQPKIESEPYLALDEPSTIIPRHRNNNTNGYKNDDHKNNKDETSIPEQPPTLEKVNLQIWDTAGQERFNSISQAFYRGTDVVVLVYDITNYESVLSIRDWFERFMNHCHVDKPGVIIVGNKADKTNERCIEIEEIREILIKNSKISVDDYVDNWETDLQETSSKNLQSVEKLFLRVAELGLELLDNDINNESDDIFSKSGQTANRARKRNILGFDRIDLTDGHTATSSSCAC